MSTFKNYLNTFRFTTTLPGNGQDITFTPVRVGQIKSLLLYETSNDQNSTEDALDDMITECVVSPEDFDIKKLYLQDRFYLLVDIRKATRGALYNFQTVCTSCSSQTNQVLDITKLVVTKLNLTPSTADNVVLPTKKKIVRSKSKITEVVPEQQDTFDTSMITVTKAPVLSWDVVKLNDNISVKLSLITRGMQQEAFDIFKSIHKDEEVSDVRKAVEMADLLFALSIQSIITPDGEDKDISLEDKIYFLNNIQQSELETLSGWYDKNDFGIDFSFDVVCAHCGYSERKAVPVENFFY